MFISQIDANKTVYLSTIGIEDSVKDFCDFFQCKLIVWYLIWFFHCILVCYLAHHNYRLGGNGFICKTFYLPFIDIVLYWILNLPTNVFDTFVYYAIILKV